MLVTLTTERTDRLSPGATLRAGSDSLEVVAARPHQERWIVHFAGVEDRSAAEALRGTALEVHAPVEPEGDELWVHTVIGAEVFLGDGTRVGAVTAVHANPAHDLLELDDETLIPVVFVVSSSATPAGRALVIDPPAGLLPEPSGSEAGERPKS